MPMPDVTSSGARAMRLIFEFEGESVTLVSQQPVDMVITGYDLARAQHPGYYVDTRNADDDVLTRVHAHDAFNDSVEVFPEKPGEPIRRVPVAKRRGAFTVVVPVPEGADHVAVVRVAPMAEPAPKTAVPTVQPAAAPKTSVTDIAQFPLLISQ